MASGSQNNTSFQAQKWTNLRAFTIGNTAKDVDGTAAVSWSKNEILGASDSTKFYRGDKTWSNTLTNMLILDNGSVNGELLRLVGVNDKTFSFKLTSPSGQTDATNVDIGWDWAAGDGAGAAFRSALFPNQPGYFVIYARTNTTNEYTLVGKTDGTLTWTGKIIPNTGNTTGTVGGATDPVWVNAGVITAITAGTTGQFYRGDKTWSNILTGALDLKSDLNLYTASADSPDIVWWYADKGKEQARLWMGSGFSSKAAPNFREYKSDGTSLYSGVLPLGDGTGASGTWEISVTGNAATATKFNSTRTIKLTGAVTGSATTDGGSGWEIATTKNHTHPISEVTWGGGQNLTCTPTAANQEYSIDLGNAYTGTYWHVWSAKNSKSILICYNDNMNVSVPNGTLTAKAFSGPLTGNVTGNADTATNLVGISMTGGNGNTGGRRLIYTWTINAWSNHRLTFAVTSRHTGSGLVAVSVGCNSSTVSLANCYAEIKYFGPTGSGGIISATSYEIYINSAGTTAYLFWQYSDYNDTSITPISGGLPSNGTWTENPASYGTLKAQTEINPSSVCYGNAATATTATNLSGGTVSLQANQYQTDSKYGLNANNSDIIGLNRLQWADKADAFNEGIMFVNGSSGYDCMAAAGGAFYFRSATDGTPGLSQANATASLYAARFYGAVTGNVTGNCSGSSGSCTGNAATATKATQDGSGNTITSKYVTVDTAQTITGTKSWGTSGAGGQLNGAATDGGVNSIRIGNDVWLGDCNTGGIMGMKSTGAHTGFYFYNSSGTQTGQLYADGSEMICNKTYHSSGGYLKSTANGNTLTMGSQNASWCHFASGVKFHFGQAIWAVDGFHVTNGSGSDLGANYTKTECTVNNTNGKIGLNSSTNRGLYEYTDSKWIIYLQHSDDTVRSSYKIYGAVWNDYAEFREGDVIEGGYTVYDDGYGRMKLCTQRMQPGSRVTSDTYGIAVGHTNTAKTPIGVSGRVLAYPAQPRNNYKVGDAVCSAPGGKIDIMTRDEIQQYPDRIIGIVSEVPDYDIWDMSYKAEEEKEAIHTNIKVNGRIWIYVK